MREARIPVSPVCQKALAEAVRLVGRARKTVERLRDPDFDPAAVPQIGSRIGSLMTLRLSQAIRLAGEVSGPAGRVETKHLLIGLLDEGHNLGVRLLQALGVDADELRDAALQIDAAEASPAAAGEPGGPRTSGDASLWTGLSLPARMSIASALEASIDLGHNYLGCEHLLLGLLDTPDSEAARVLHSFGVDEASARRAVTSAISGFTHAWETSATADTSKLDEIVHRLDAVERRLGPQGSDGWPPMRQRPAPLWVLMPCGTLPGMTEADPKTDLHRYLRGAREALLWKLDGLSEYDIRRPLTPTGTNLLGLVKHLASVELGYFGDTFGRPPGEPYPWQDGEHAEPNADMHATADESRAQIVGLYRRACAHSDETINLLGLDAIGHVPWWPPEHREVTLHRILVHVVAETNRHAGHADIVRELIDGAAGFAADDDNLAPGDKAWWDSYRDRVERAAQEASRG